MAQGDQRRFHALRVLGETIRHYRLQQRLSISELARRAQLDRTFVGRLEHGLYDPSLLHLWRLARVLRVPLTTLVEPLNMIDADEPEC
jgi:transcriptional regulator with XRE-family HTH domain